MQFLTFNDLPHDLHAAVHNDELASTRLSSIERASRRRCCRARTANSSASASSSPTAGASSASEISVVPRLHVLHVMWAACG
eukprot:6183993-Pleurochrysis_carterae.AAC.1